MKNNQTNPTLLYWLVIISLVISVFAATYSYKLIELHSINATMDRREAVRDLTAALVQERLEQIFALGNSVVHNEQFQQQVLNNEWEEALKNIVVIPENYQFIDRVFLTDAAGVLQVDFPELPGGVRGRSFAERDWYKGVTANWQPYISEVYQRTALPQENVIAAAFPIFNETQQLNAILVLQVSLKTFQNWTNDINPIDGSSTYILDQSGQVVAMPNINFQTEIISLAGLDEVKKIKAGESGLQIVTDPESKEEKIVAYQPIPTFNWGILISQPTAFAFLESKQALQTFVIVYGILFSIHLGLAYLILRTGRVINQQKLEFEALLKNIGDGVVAINNNLQVTYVNDMAMKMSGYSLNEILGKNLRETFKFIKSQNRQESTEFIQESLITGKLSHPKENILLVRKDGKEIPVGDTVAPILDKDTKVLGAIIVFRDTTEELASNRTRSSLAYSSHQLRTPVTKALWGLEMALEEDDQEERTNYLQHAYLAVKSVRKLTDQIGEVSKIDQGLIAVKSEPVEISKILREAIESTAKQLGVKSERFVLEQPDLGININTDPDLLKKILIELLDNAATYSDKDSLVHLGYSKQQGGILFEIADQGFGITEEEQVAVFNKFFRGSNFDTTQVVGAGLGLYICKEYTNLLNGKIWFSSKENKGTSFYVLIPESSESANS